MSEPRAAGVRTTYAAVPAAVRAWVDDLLGAPVVDAEEQTGGFSPGCATRVRCADGRRAFVKAVGVELNPDSPTLFRREADALRTIGEHPLWAGLLGVRDEDGWVALVLDDVEGSHPDLSDDAVMARLLESTDRLGAVLRERAVGLAPGPPVDGVAPLFAPGPVDLARVFAGLRVALDEVDDLPAELAPAWLRERAPDLRTGLAELAAQPMTQPVHHDVRHDNLLARPTGEIVFVDWGAFGVGPDWLDPLLARLERVGSPWFDRSVRRSPALVRAGDDVVTTWLAGLGCHLAWRAHTAVDVNLPTLAAFRRAESARFLGAAARRLGI